MVKLLIRKDDPEQRIELVRWQVTLRGWFGFTAMMITNRRAPGLFPRCTWEEISNTGDAN
jgi:hypothetical protein